MTDGKTSSEKFSLVHDSFSRRHRRDMRQCARMWRSTSEMAALAYEQKERQHFRKLCADSVWWLMQAIWHRETANAGVPTQVTYILV